MKYTLFIIAAAIGGVVISYINYLILKSALKNSTDKRAFYISPLRSVLAAAYLFAIYFLANKLGFSTIGPLIAGAIGLTFSLFVFTKMLLSIQKGNNDNIDKEA